MSAPSPLIAAAASLSRSDQAHLRRLQASWGMLADLCFGDLVLYLVADEGTLVIANHIRPTTAQTVYQSDLVGETRTAQQRPVVAEALGSGRVVSGVVESAWAGEGLRIQAIPIRRNDRTIAVMARESAISVRTRPGQLESTYQGLFDRFASMLCDGTFPYGDEAEHLSFAPRVGDGVVVLNAQGIIEYASPNANSALIRAGVAGVILGRTLVESGFDSAAVRSAIASSEPAVDEVVTEGGASLAVRALPVLDGRRTTGLLVLLRDVSDVRARDRLLLSKDATIREIHHRVKNNLQTISSLLRLQGRRLQEPTAKLAIEESVRRIRAIALVHEALSRDAGDDVAVVAVIRSLIRMVEEGLVSPDRPIRFEVEGDGGVVTSQVATGLSVVLSELLQNTVEHAFPPEWAGDGDPIVRISLSTDGHRLVMTVCDNGVGLPNGVVPAPSDRLGLSIVTTLVESELGGSIRFSSGDGAVGADNHATMGAAVATGTFVTLDVPFEVLHP